MQKMSRFFIHCWKMGTRGKFLYTKSEKYSAHFQCLSFLEKNARPSRLSPLKNWKCFFYENRVVLFHLPDVKMGLILSQTLRSVSLPLLLKIDVHGIYKSRLKRTDEHDPSSIILSNAAERPIPSEAQISLSTIYCIFNMMSRC